MPEAAKPMRRLTMRYAGGIVKHLGLAMYRGSVPAIAELISNAWDADAKRTSVTMPFGIGMKDQEILIADDGDGMSWDDVESAYLVVGRDRRKATGSDRTARLGRLVMGRKGLGKLAGFGIARVVEVRTVRDKWLTHFRLDFERMTKSGQAEMVEGYEPEILADGLSDEPAGTTILLKELLISRAVDEEDFRQSMSRRFSILGNGFEVVVNGKPIAPYKPNLQFLFEGPNGGWEDVPGVGSVKWWFGFTDKPIPTDSARGISILVRDKMAQAPFFFDLSGGAYGQAGMQYMTGEVSADQLDDAQDFIGTDRQGIVWTEPLPEALLNWGVGKIRESLRAWAEKRSEVNRDRLEKVLIGLDKSVEDRISRLMPREQAEARAVVRKLASIESVTDDLDRARELLDLVLRAFEDGAFFALIKALGQTDQAEREQILKLVTELDVFETVKYAELVRARVEVIHKFQEMIANDVPEKPDMQDFLFDHPWLIDPEWIVVEHEKGLETLLVDHFKLDPQADPDSDKRVDFFCVSTRGRYLVVEVKRPSKPIGQQEVVQVMNYVSYLRQQAPGQSGRPNHYEGVLVGHHVTPDGVRWRELADKSQVVVKSWRELLDAAERTHREFLEAVKKRVPGDARVQSLPPLDSAKVESTGPDVQE